MNQQGIRSAVEQITQQWRSTTDRQWLITQLTTLDWQARTLDNDEPVDEVLIDQIARLRSQIWLSS